MYAFGPLLLDLNRRLERFVPGRASRLADCSTEEFFCLTALREGRLGVVAFSGPRRCSDFRVGDSWNVAGVRLSVLARYEPPRTEIRDSVDYHRQRSWVLYYLGNEDNPAVVYEYAGQSGVVAILHGLTSRPNLVREIRNGLDPATLPAQHRMELSTLDRFAPCRSGVD